MNRLNSNPAHIWRVTTAGNIPNIRPQIDLNLLANTFILVEGDSLFCVPPCTRNLNWPIGAGKVSEPPTHFAAVFSLALDFRELQHNFNGSFGRIIIPKFSDVIMANLFFLNGSRSRRLDPRAHPDK